MSDDKPVVREHKGHWAKGQSGNPKGRPRREVEREYLDVMMSKVTPEKWAEITEKALSLAIRGDSKSREFLARYLLGDPVHVHEYLFAKKEDVTIRVIFGSGNQPLLEGQQPIEGDWDIVDADSAESEIE